MQFLVLLAAVLLQDDPAARWVEKLHSDRIEERNEAAVQLRKMGKAAQPALEKAAEEKDPDAAQLAKATLKAILEDLASEGPLLALARMEEKMAKAKTLRVRFELESEVVFQSRDQKVATTGELTLKEGNRMALTLKMKLL